MAGTLLFGSNEAADHHDTGPGHPERWARLPAVDRGLAEAGLGDAVSPLSTRAATRQELLRAHTPAHVEHLEAFIHGGGHQLDPDTGVSSGSWDTALLACGAGLAAIDALDRGEGSSAFVGIRPPGHHATANRAMGFCLLNNVAVSAAALAERGERVLIVDWDVHHGNGTQDIFWDDPRVLYVSTHQWPCYPGTGRPEETGGPSAPRLNINIPLPPGATGDVARAAMDEIVAPAVDEFSPTWVLISAGFDAHRSDPLASLEWSAGDYTDLTNAVSAFAPCDGRVVVFLEGGYDLDALALSAGATAAALTGVPYRPEAATSGGPGRSVVEALSLAWRR